MSLPPLKKSGFWLGHEILSSPRGDEKLAIANANLEFRRGATVHKNCEQEKWRLQHDNLLAPTP
jgi:hypothetical protein